ncbi:MAG: 2-polyprenylphenol 6-hydroxylase [Rhodospirillales bacterium]|nr:MAG: 2-polyprenylphenol 6-hydroxylase [Rhodospirillales bacterium]
MIRDVRHACRLLLIAHTLARHDALFPLERLGVAAPITALTRWVSRRREPGRPGQRLARALQESGPSFIKMGQALSSRPDLIGEDVAADLSDLQDRVAPFPGAEARATIEAELEAPISSLFRSFDDQPVAAASIAQVHHAVDTEGREVAVKVLRPGVEEAFTRDLDLFFWMAELIEMARPDLRRLRPMDSIRTIAETVEMEMDLRFEAAAAVELAENLADDPGFRIPRVDWGRTGSRVLTTEWLPGIPIDDRHALISAGHDPEALLAKAAEVFFLQVFRDGYFHADLHAGNLSVRPDGSIVAVDFGIMGRIDRKTRLHLAELLLAFLSRDYRRAAEVHFAAGWVPAHRSVDAFTQACRSIAEPIMDKPQNEISIAKLLGHLFQVTKTFDMETQPNLLLLQRTMLVAEGTGRSLCPDANMWLLARPLMEHWMREKFSPEAKLREVAADVRNRLARAPELLGKLEAGASALADGAVRLHPDTIRAIRRDDRRQSMILIWATVIVVLALIVLA